MEFSPVPAVLTSQYACSCLERERRDTGASTGSQMGLHETGHHRRSQASRQHLGKSTQPDKLANNSHTHTTPAPAHFQELSKTEKGRENIFLIYVKSHHHNTRLLDGLNQNSPSQNLYRIFFLAILLFSNQKSCIRTLEKGQPISFKQAIRVHSCPKMVELHVYVFCKTHEQQ